MPGTRNRTLTSALPLALAVVGTLATAIPAAQAAPDRAAPDRAAPDRAGAHHSRPSHCRGQGVDASARIRYRSDVVIKAPLSTVWKLQTDVERWPSWQQPVLTAERLDPGRLGKGSRFRWTTPAPATPTTPATTLEITSTVRQLQRGACVLWSGPAVGQGLRIDEGVHLWTFTEVKGGVRVHTEETWTGAQVEADVPTATAALGAGLEAWLHDLKTTAEHRRK
ncbi:SRPBCC family protein [Streptomyces sp. SLBN-115]|uniref:SRPBCC family protein n=1 Tax=Streptomyces sp. SLBN-115 TaxID=2768453 RepID=UPI00114FA2F0|nr:SRPBCC family protein [Streptomyces sp. SLBN-115]TQJ54453.1 polyketide cyclase/dehydrase/lipid transport protein [Streptomyces sp. SLBN-115]